jgi:hypothetical protein
MKKILLYAVMFILLATAADGASDTIASTISRLVSYETNFCALRTISDSSVSTPDLNFMSTGQVDSSIQLSSSSTAKIEQGTSFEGIRNGNFGGLASFSSSVTGQSVTGISSSITGTAYATAGNPTDAGMVQSISSGLCMADPGSEEYELSINGGHSTLTNAPMQPTSGSSGSAKSITASITMNLYPLEFVVPADSLYQDVNLDLKMENNNLAGYSYDFSQAIDLEGTTCDSGMNLLQLM